MIELLFVRKGAMIKVYIKEKVVTMIAPQLGNQPVIFDVNKAKESKDEKMLKLLEAVDLKDFNEFVDDESCAKSIITDFQNSSWRCVKR
jgi:hypothetical protein